MRACATHLLVSVLVPIVSGLSTTADKLREGTVVILPSFAFSRLRVPVPPQLHESIQVRTLPTSFL